MKLGIDPKVDYAFKKLFGSPQNKRLLIAFLDAVLGEAIIDVEILNPFTEKDFVDDKLSILDIKARLGDGRLVNIDMQMVVNAIYPSRALYYWAKTYHQQLSEGEEYAELRPTISIHVLNEVVFPDVPKYHSQYQLRESDHPGVVFSKHLQIHAIELPKFEMPAEALVTPLERWCYFLRHGKELEPGALPPTLKEAAIEKAMEVLEVMTHNDRERFLLEAQERATRDALTNKKAFIREGLEAGRQEGIRQGIQEGKELGIQQGKELGIQQGKELGMQEGKELGMRQERLEAIEMMLEMKFGAAGGTLMETVRGVEDLARLRELQQLLRTPITFQEFRDRLA